jgi:hypothetical protein
MFGHRQAFGLSMAPALDIAWGLRPDWPPMAARSTRPVSDRVDEIRNRGCKTRTAPRGGRNPLEKTTTPQ